MCRARVGSAAKLTYDTVEAVITHTLETRPKNATHWSTRTMAGRMFSSWLGASRVEGEPGVSPSETAGFMP